MSFVSSIFRVKSLERFEKFCDVTGVKYEVEDPTNGDVIIYSDGLCEPPDVFTWQGQEQEIDFNAELHKLMAPGQRVSIRIEYELEIHPTGEVEFYCDDMVGMPPEGDSNAEANPHPQPVF